MSMVERVADAISARRGMSPERIEQDKRLMSHHRRQVLDEARAAIAAMREPPREMARAAVLAFRGADHEADSTAEIARAMLVAAIDAALAERDRVEG